MRILCLLISVLWLLSSVAARADFDAGTTVYERGDFTTAMTEWLPMADSGDAEAQAILGFIYFAGAGVPHSNPLALRWFMAAAEQAARERGWR